MLKVLMKALMLIGLVHVSANANLIEVEVTKYKDKKKSFCSKVSLYNPSSTSQAWEISFNPKGTIKKAWGVNYEQNPETLATIVSGKKRRTIIDANGTISFKYCAKKIVEAPLEGDLVITETELKDNEKRFCKRVHVNNVTDKVIDWEINMPIKGQISKLWNANYTQDPETLELNANGIQRNNLIYANSSIKFRYCAKKFRGF